MYFDQYFIKPAFATLTSLLRTYRRHLAVAFLYIFRVLVSAGLIRPAFSFRLFQSFFVCFPRHPPLSFSALPFGWECKGRNLFLTSK